MKRLMKTITAAAFGGAIYLSGWGGVPVNAAGSGTFATVVNVQPQQNLTFQVTFLDGFRAKITNHQTKKSTVVDLEANKTRYMQWGVYASNGKLLKPLVSTAEKLGQIVPVRQPDGKLHWIGKQTITSAIQGDRVATATSVWTMVNNKPKLLGVTISNYDWDNQPSPAVDVNSAFNIGRDNTYVLDTKYADVTGDGERDHVLLIGYKEGVALNLHAQDLRVVIRDGKTNQMTAASVGEKDKGFMPKLHIAHLNGDKVKDVLITMPTRTGNVYSLMSWKYADPVFLLDQKRLNDRSQYQVVVGENGVGTAVRKIKGAK